MSLRLLIDSIVRQTTVLIAELATAQGVRAPLAHIANQVFLELTRELDRQGVSRKVSANMFGLALRTYLRRIRRLEEGVTEEGQSLSDAVLSFLRERASAEGGDGLVLRAEVLQRFVRDEPDLVRSVLRDLCDTGLAMRTGRGDQAAYRASSPQEVSRLSEVEPLDDLLWAIIYREGPVGTQELEGRGLGSEQLAAALGRLKAQGRVQQLGRGESVRWSAQRFLVPLDSASGWEGAVFDHYQAMVRTIVQRLAAQGPAPHLGGSTYSFEIWPGHPHRERVMGLLQEYRERVGQLRQEVSEYNQRQGRPVQLEVVTSYAGQSLVHERRVDADAEGAEAQSEASEE